MGPSLFSMLRVMYSSSIESWIDGAGEKVRCLLKRRVARLPFKTTFEERKRMIDKPFGEMKVGDSSVSRGRTVTETDIINFAMIMGMWPSYRPTTNLPSTRCTAMVRKVH